MGCSLRMAGHGSVLYGAVQARLIRRREQAGLFSSHPSCINLPALLTIGEYLAKASLCGTFRAPAKIHRGEQEH